MSLLSNGNPPDVIREMMPPYHLSTDLLEGAFAALPPPPQDAPPTWRGTRITRLTQEISTLMPANAAQARMAAQILVLREMADTLTTRAYAPGVTVEQMDRLGRASAALVQTATSPGRALARCQAKPAPFFGTVLADEVDVAAVDALWCNRTPPSAAAGAVQQAGTPETATPEPPTPEPATPEPATGIDPVGLDPVGLRPGGEAASDVTPASGDEAAPAGGVGPEPPADRPVTAPLTADAEPSPAVSPMPPSADAAVRAQPGRSPDPARRLGRDTRSIPERVVTRLDQGPGWTLEVVRPRAGSGAAPGSAT